MPASPAPNERIADLVSILGEADARELAQLFLASLNPLRLELSSGDRVRASRAAHSLKSSSQQMGLARMAGRMAQLEQRLLQIDGVVTDADLDAVASELSDAEATLRPFAGPGQPAGS